MGFSAKVITDSISPEDDRLTTFEVEYPHAIHKDIMTHRMFDRNFQSFRAFPPEKVVEKITVDPFRPESFEARVKGMGQGDQITEQNVAVDLWQKHIDHSLTTASAMINLDVAKAQVNFVLQDLTWIRGVITATDWDNFWALRSQANNVRPEVKKIASMMEEAYNASEPNWLSPGEWHLPYIDVNDYHYFCIRPDEFFEHPYPELLGFDWDSLKKISAGRCARISYLTHDGERDWGADIQLATNLIGDGHMSPLGHQATPFSDEEWHVIAECQVEISKHLGVSKHKRNEMCRQLEYRGNLRGWHQFRKDIPNEHNFALYGS